jgi:hypothetical protein
VDLGAERVDGLLKFGLDLVATTGKSDYDTSPARAAQPKLRNLTTVQAVRSIGQPARRPDGRIAETGKQLHIDFHWDVMDVFATEEEAFVRPGTGSA